MSDSTPVAAADQEVVITRLFDAPREQVFHAWTDPTRSPPGTAPSTSTRRVSGSASIRAWAGATSSR
jgi:uncharacterized protein YndB with AHSA1/START domain